MKYFYVFSLCKDMELQRVNDSNGQLEYIEPDISAGNGRQSKIFLPTNEILSLKGFLDIYVSSW